MSSTATILIKKNATGEVRRYEHNGFCENSKFQWTDGNFGCDCNRHLFFVRSKDDEREEDWEFPCGESEYSIQGAEVDGRFIALGDFP